MDCQDIRQLLAFVDRKSEELDAAERAAVQQHLDRCTDCAEIAQAERGFDQAVGAAMRDVAIPADLQHNVLKRLAGERAVGRWKRIAIPAAAAVVLLSLAAGGAWLYVSPRAITPADVAQFTVVRHWEQGAASRYLKQHGFDAPLPDGFDYRWLHYVETVQLKGKPVAKVGFYNPDHCTASVLILPWNQFNLSGVEEDPTAVRIIRDEAHRVTYLILFRGNLDRLFVDPGA